MIYTFFPEMQLWNFEKIPAGNEIHPKLWNLANYIDILRPRHEMDIRAYYIVNLLSIVGSLWLYITKKAIWIIKKKSIDFVEEFTH